LTKEQQRSKLAMNRLFEYRTLYDDTDWHEVRREVLNITVTLEQSAVTCDLTPSA